MLTKRQANTVVNIIETTAHDIQVHHASSDTYYVKHPRMNDGGLSLPLREGCPLAATLPGETIGRLTTALLVFLRDRRDE